MKNISCSDTKQLFKIFSDVKETKLINVTDESYVQQYHSNLIEYIKIKKLDKSDLSYVKEDFENVSREAFSYMRGLLRFYEEIIKLSDIVTWKFDFHKALALDCIVLSQFFYSDHFWSDERCSAIAYKILNQLLNFFKCKNINELFFGGDNINKAFKKLYPNGVLKLLLEEFVSIFKKNSWKNYPSYKDTFSWILFNVQSPQMSDYVVYFLPPALFILDDWELENKVYGVKALQHMMKNLPSSELRWYGRANVIFDALNHNLHTREPSVLEVAYPATILAASILEKCPKTAKSMQKKFYDGLMDRLLSEMNFEQMLKLRTIYAHALKLLVEEMKLFSVKWCDSILEVCSNYLGTYEGEEAQDRILILETLEILVKSCWPRMKLRLNQILKMILQLTYELNLENSPVKNKMMVLEKIKNVVVVLSAADPKTTSQLCQQLVDLDINHKEDILFVVKDFIVD